MFNGRYIESNRKRAKAIIDFYGHKFLYMKKVLDLGCGHGDMGGMLQRLGADVTLVDAREEHLKVALKKYPGAKVLKADLDGTFPIIGKKFDFVLSLDILCHLKDYEKHLRQVCAITTHLILETAVCDSNDPGKCLYAPENSGIYDLSLNGMGCRPSAAAIERILDECNMEFRRIDDPKLNSGDYVYNWQETNSDSIDQTKRRFWFAKKKDSIYKFAIPVKKEVAPPTVIVAAPIEGRYKRPGSTPIHKVVQYTQEQTQQTINKNFVIIIPSFNNQKYCEKNILSALNQNYPNYRIIFTDDCSTDDTFNKVNSIVSYHANKSKCSLIKNKNRLGALQNIYNMVHSCSDNEIIITLDGDDWLENNNVLTTLNKYYQDDTWMTYGQYKTFPDNTLGISKEIPSNILKTRRIRTHKWSSSHLRTFYAWLFKKINVNDLKNGNSFYEMAWDLAMMMPMLEMATTNSKFVNEILYVYNTENPINDSKVDAGKQIAIDKEIRSKEKYKELQKEKGIATFRDVGRNGRLGNQMFQVAALLAYAAENNLDARLNWYCTYSKDNISKYFKNKINNNISDIKIENSYQEPFFHYQKIPKLNNVSLSGFYQSEKYFEKHKDLIKCYFEPEDSFINQIKEKYKDVLNTSTCAIHVRRGDYVNNKTHSVCDLSYFNRAIDYVKSKTTINNFLIFSDDMNWCKNNLKLDNVIYVEGNKPIEDMFLMSLCKNFIISNSSLSWWGSYLASNENKIIVSPTKWFADNKNNDSDVFTKEMVKL